MVHRTKLDESDFFLNCIVELFSNRHVSMSTLEMMVISCTFWHLRMLEVSMHLETEQQLLASVDITLLKCTSFCMHAQNLSII